MLFDLPLEQLQAYCPPRDEPADFDTFWAKTLAEALNFPLEADFVPVDAGLRLVDTFDVTYRGYGGQPIKGWLMLPRALAPAVRGRIHRLRRGARPPAGLAVVERRRLRRTSSWTRVARAAPGASATPPTSSRRGATPSIPAS